MSHFASMLFWWFLQGVGFAPDSYWMWLLMRCSLWSKPDWPVGHVWPTSYVWPWLPLVTLSLPMSFPFFDCWILQPGFRIMRSLLNPKIFQPALLHSWVKTWKDLKSKRGKELLRCLYAHSIKPRQSCLKILDLLYLDELHILPTANDNIEAESEPFHAVLAWTEADVMQVHIYDGTGHGARHPVHVIKDRTRLVALNIIYIIKIVYIHAFTNSDYSPSFLPPWAGVFFSNPQVHHGTPYNYGVWSTLGNLSNRWTTVDYPWKIWYRDPLQPQAVDPDRSYKRQSIDTTGRTDTDSMCSVWYLKKNVYEVEHRVILTGRVYLTLRQIRNFCPENCRYTKAVLSPCSNCRANLRFLSFLY